MFLYHHVIQLSKNFDILFISSSNKPYFILDGKKYKNSFISLKRSINFFNFVNNLIKLYKNISKNKYDLLISIHPKNAFLISIIKYFLKIKVVHIITGQIWANNNKFYKSILKLIDKFIISKYDHLLVDGKSQITFLKNYGFDVKKIKLISNGSICGVATSEFSKSPSKKLAYIKKNSFSNNTKIILFAGRINFDKGILILLDAFNELILNYNYNINLLIVGDDEINISTYINKYSKITKKRINIYGFKKNIKYYYSISDIFCLPSYREGFGLSVIQASASYLPVVVSKIYGLQDSMKDKVTGLKFDNTDYLDLVFKLKYLLDNPSKIKEFGNNGRLFVDNNFNQKNVVNFFDGYIKNII